MTDALNKSERQRKPARDRAVVIFLGLALAAGIVLPSHEALASQVSARSDILSNASPSATSNHTIAFTVQNNLVSQGGAVPQAMTASSNLAITFPSGFSLSTLTCNDIDLSIGGSATSFNTSSGDSRTNCGNTVTAWGVNVDPTARVLLLTTPTSVAQYVWVATGTVLTVKIGSNATFQGTGSNWITNPSAAGVYTISVGGTFGGTGNMLVWVGLFSPIQFVQSSSTLVVVSSQNSVAFPSNNTAGNLIVVSAGWTGVGTTASISDSEGNLYATAVGPVTNSNGGFRLQVWYAKSIKGGANTVTVSYTASPGNADTEIHEYSGLDAFSPLDATASSTGDGTTASSGPATTNFANELIFGYAENEIQGPGFTRRESQENDTSEDMTVSVADSYAALFTGVAAHWAASMATFKAATVSNAVQVSAIIPESLSLSVSSISALGCTADDGASVNSVSATGPLVAFGTLSANTFYQGCQDLIVSTNAGNGYSVTVQESSAMRTADGRFSIPDTACDAGDCSVVTATTWVTPTKNGFGHTCSNQSGSDCNPTYGNGKKFKPVPNVAGGTGPGVVQHRQQCSGGDMSGSGFNAISCTLPVQTATGNAIIVSISYDTSNSPTSTISDTAGDSFNLSCYIKDPTNVLQATAVFIAANIKANASDQITANFTNFPPFLGIVAHEYAGLAASAIGDGCAPTLINYYTQTPSSTLTTAVNGDLIYAVANDSVLGIANSAGIGFTKRADPLNSFGLADEDQEQTSFGTINGYFTATSVSQYTAITAAYEAAPGIGQTIMSNTGTVTNSTGRVKYRLSVPSNQAAGTYTTVITYTILGTF